MNKEEICFYFYIGGIIILIGFAGYTLYKVLYIDFDNNIKLQQEIALLKNIDNYMNLRQLCSNQECNDYFNQRIEYNLKLFKELVEKEK
jgi:hypothetical protein